MRFIHFSDLHFSEKNQERALQSLHEIDAAIDDTIDFLIIAGDLFDHGVQNSASSGFTALLQIIGNILDKVPILCVYGTVTHDVPGCYAVFENLGRKNQFHVIYPGTPIICEDYMVLGCPEPTKNYLITNAPDMTVKDAMRKLLLGLGAMRAEHPELPCVFIYHGLVEGASMDNSQIVKPGDVTIGRDDLALVGADYCALGHIHAAQQIDGLPAYYAGSAFPTTWGETEQKGFNAVTFTGEQLTGPGYLSGIQKSRVNFLPFSCPPRKKIVSEAGLFFDKASISSILECEGIAGFQVWLELRALKNEFGEDKRKSVEAFMLNGGGALPGSRVTISIIPDETVRAVEIQTARSLIGKVEVWAENTGKSVPEGVPEKVLDLEEKARHDGIAADGAEIEIKSLKLRGAIGIWKGLGLDEIEINFDNYDAGLVALVGKNGSGKTTLLENLHPFPSLLTRPGKLADHFRLKDSFRDLLFSDGRSGAVYRALINIDGEGQAGKCEYFLFKDGQPVTNGRKEDYERAIGVLFGSLELFLRSAFSTQKATKNAPALEDATKGEKKSLFRELAGMEYLQTLTEVARENSKGILDSVASKRGLLDGLKRFLQAHIDLTASLKSKETERDTWTDKRHASEMRGHDINNDIMKAEILIGQQREAQAEALSGYTDALRAWQLDQGGIDKRVRELEAKKHGFEIDLNNKKTARESLMMGVEELLERIGQKITCPSCGHGFNLDADKLSKKLTEKQEQVCIYDQEIPSLEVTIRKMTSQIVDTIAERRPEPVKPAAPEVDQALIVKLGKLKADVDQARREYSVADRSVAALTQEIKDIQRRIDDAVKQDAERAALEVEIARLEREAADWAFIEQALGPDGVQALELDALAPTIAEIANRLLSDAYGSRFSIEFQTTRISGNGSKAKQIEDFLIIVNDSENGTAQELSTLSGGEGTWVKKAIYDAFGIIRYRNTGLKFLTAFADESDGALDVESKRAYFNMMLAAHNESGRKHTIVITHSAEAQEMIENKIEMASFVREEIFA